MKFAFFLSGREHKETGAVISRNMLQSLAGCRSSPRGRKARVPLTELLAELKHSAPFQRHRPAPPFRDVPPSQIAEDRLPRPWAQKPSPTPISRQAAHQGHCRNFRPRRAPKTSLTSAAPGKPMA